MENEPISYLEKQKESNETKLSAAQIKNGINRWAKFEKNINKNLERITKEFIKIKNNIRNVIIDANGGIQGFKFTDRKKIYNELSDYYCSRSKFYNRALIFLYNVNKLIKASSGDIQTYVKVGKDNNEKLITMQSRILSSKNLLDQSIKSLNNELHDIYNLNFDNVNNAIIKQVQNHFSFFNFTTPANQNKNIDCQAKTMPISNKKTSLDHFDGNKMLLPNKNNDNLVDHMSQQRSPTENYILSPLNNSLFNTMLSPHLIGSENI